MSCCGGKGVSVWRDTKAQWECADCGAVKSNDPNYLYSGMNPLAGAPTRSFTKICECGSEKTHGINSSHSHWCPKA